MFLDQTYTGEHTLFIYNNSPNKEEIDYDLSLLPENKKIVLVNNHLDLITGKEYTNTGDIFRDALSICPLADCVSHLDVDDCYLPNHIEEGIMGFKGAILRHQRAYKPYYSYFWNNGRIYRVHNTLEPSFFIDYNYLKEKGYRPTSVDYNQGWEEPLRKENMVFVDPEGISTFIYDWSGKTGVHKLSGGENTQTNFNNHRTQSNNVGDGKITPISKEDCQYYYNLVKEAI